MTAEPGYLILPLGQRKTSTFGSLPWSWGLHNNPSWQLKKYGSSSNIRPCRNHRAVQQCRILSGSVELNFLSLTVSAECSDCSLAAGAAKWYLIFSTERHLGVIAVLLIHSSAWSTLQIHLNWLLQDRSNRRQSNSASAGLLVWWHHAPALCMAMIPCHTIRSQPQGHGDEWKLSKPLKSEP